MSRVRDSVFVKELDTLVQQNPNWNIVDVGGGMYPYKRANYIVDFKEYGTVPERSFGNWPHQYWNKDTWIKSDICDTQTPLPFEDKFFDFSICMHTLEDIRNPIHVCHELMRISKRGYIETPSRIDESIFNNSYVGYANHRWFVEDNKDELVFTMKSHCIYESNKMYLPSNYQFLQKNDDVMIFWWDDSFKVKEDVIIHMDEWKQKQLNFINSLNTPIK